MAMISRHKDIYILLILSLILLFLNLGLCGLRNTEGRWACVAQHMYDSGEIFTMKIGGDDYYDKPFLSYWLILLFSKAMGGVSETTVRLPSALAGVAVLFITYIFACRLFGKKEALLSALILCTSVGFIHWARHGQVDMLNLLGILLGIWIFFCYKNSDRIFWIYILSFVMAIGSWLKGPLCYTVPGFVIFLYSLVFKDWNWFKIKHLAAAGFFSLVLYFVPFILAWRITGKWDALYMVYVENVLRFIKPFDHVRPFYLYFSDMLIHMMPWSVFLPWALVYVAKRWRDQTPEFRHLLIIIAGIFIFFSLSGSRRSYYLIPVLPFTSVFMALFLLALPDLSHIWKRSFGVLWALCAIVSTMIGLSFLIGGRKFLTHILTKISFQKENVDEIISVFPSWELFALAFAFCIIGVMLLILAFKNLDFKNILGYVGCVYIGMILSFGVLIPKLDTLRSGQEFIMKVSGIIPEKSRVAFFPKLNPTFVFYLQIYHEMKDYKAYQSIEKARKSLVKSGGFLIADRILSEDWEKLCEEKRISLEDRNRNLWLLYRPKK